MKRKITIKPDADDDLLTIWFYGYLNFGQDLANEYNLGLSDLFEGLTANELGRKRKELGNKMFAIPYREHTVFYYAEDNEIFIIRILHHSQDIPTNISLI
jgi:toxin ParE1/3/4